MITQSGADQVLAAFDGGEVDELDGDGSDLQLPPDDGAPRAPMPGAADLDRDLAALALNDTGNGQRLLARHADRLLFVRDVGPHVWTGTHWDGDGGFSHACKLAQQTAASIAGEARAMFLAGPRPDEGEEAWRKRVARHYAWGTTSGNAGRVTAMIAMASPHREIMPGAVDADPMALNCLNGTLRFRVATDGDGNRVAEIERTDHNREDFCSKAVAANYNTAAEAPRWRAFLERSLPDPAVRRFLQVWSGYTLTGLTGEQKLVFFWGSGANGKSTFVDLFARLLDGYAASLRFESLAGDGNRRGDAATPDLARLPGVRFLRAAEPEQGMRFKEAEVKAITGGEPLLVRHLHGRFFELRPCFKLMLSGNHKPDIRGLDEGIWRRILLVPWTVTIPPDERDPTLPEKLWAERAGVLNWALDGLRIYLESGLDIPEAVQAATASYRDESDPAGAFLRDCIERAEGQSVTARELYDAFRAWCEANAARVWTEKAFAGAMAQKGLEKTQERVRRYLNIAISPDAPRPDSAPDPGRDRGADGF